MVRIQNALLAMVILSTSGCLSTPDVMNLDASDRYFIASCTVGIAANVKQGTSLGSGVMITDDLLLTMNHVINGAHNFCCVFSLGVVCEAELIDQDEDLDVALLRLKNGSPLPLMLRSKLIPRTTPLIDGEINYSSGYVFLNKWREEKGPIIKGGKSSYVDSKFVSIEGFSGNSQKYPKMIYIPVCGARGMSGGPLVDSEMKVVGLIIGGTRGKADAADNGLLVVPIEYIIERFKKHLQ